MSYFSDLLLIFVLIVFVDFSFFGSKLIKNKVLIRIFQANVQNNEDEDHGDDIGSYADETVGLVKTLLRVQNTIVTIPNGSEHFDIYLANEIYPALVPGLEELSREIDRLVSAEDGEIDDSMFCPEFKF